MSKHDVEGERKQAEGKVQEKRAEAADDKTEKMKAKGKQAIGTVEEEYGEATD